MTFKKTLKSFFIQNNECPDNLRRKWCMFSYYLWCKAMGLKLQLKPLSYPWEKVDFAKKDSNSFF